MATRCHSCVQRRGLSVGQLESRIRLVQLFLCQSTSSRAMPSSRGRGLRRSARGTSGGRWCSASRIRSRCPARSENRSRNQPLACLLIAVGAITVDLGIITIVIWPRLRAWFISAALIFHAGILLTMGILFLNVPQFLIFVDWEVLRRRWRDARVVRRPSPSRRVAFP